MKVARRSAVEGITAIMLAAIIGGIGLFIAMTFNPLIGVLMAVGGLIPWGWACFGNREYFSEN